MNTDMATEVTVTATGMPDWLARLVEIVLIEEITRHIDTPEVAARLNEEVNKRAEGARVTA